MALREILTGPEHDEIDQAVTAVLRAHKSGRLVERDAVASLRQVIAAALAQNPGFISEVRTALRQATNA